MQTNTSTEQNIQTIRRTPRGLGTALAGLILSSATLAYGQSPSAKDYTISTVDVPAANPDIQLTYVNNSGLIAQQYQSPAGAPLPKDLHGAVLQDGVWTVIDPPGSPWSGVGGMNSHGQVPVLDVSEDGTFRTVIWQHGNYTYLPEIEGFIYGPNGFNDRGQIAGNAFYPDGSIHGFLGNSRAYEIFDYPAAGIVITLPTKINNAGTVVGEYDVAFEVFSTAVHAFLKEGDKVTNIDLPGTEATSALGLNNPGVIVGYYVLEGKRHGFIRSKSGWTSFDVTGAVQTWVSDINDHGQLAGGYQDDQGKTHGFVATPLRNAD